MWLVTCSSFCLTISGFQALKELGIEIDVYCASEIDEQAMQVGIERLFRMKSLAINFSTPPPPHTTLTKQFSWLCTTWRNKAGSLKVNYVVIPGHDNSLTPLCWFNGKTFVKEFTRLIPDILDYNLEGFKHALSLYHSYLTGGQGASWNQDPPYWWHQRNLQR